MRYCSPKMKENFIEGTCYSEQLNFILRNKTIKEIINIKQRKKGEYPCVKKGFDNFIY